MYYKSFREYLLEADGQSAGKMELVKTKLDKARTYAENAFIKNKKVLNKEIPNFDDNYLLAKKSASQGKTQRKDMPVIETEDVKLLQQRLFSGEIDVIDKKWKND
jgi:hypothetical protein